MLIAEYDLTVLYTQIIVYETNLHDFRWTDDHVAQGFAYMPGDVSFGVPDHDGMCRLQVYQSNLFNLDMNSLWAVQVPFKVTGHDLMVGTVVDPQHVYVKKGSYNLIFVALEEKFTNHELAFLTQMHFIEYDNSRSLL